MKKWATRISSVLAALLLALALPMSGYASELDGVEVTLTSDKDSYRAGDAIVLTVEVQNASDATATNVSWQVDLPEGIEADGEETLSGTVKEISPHRFWTTQVEVQASRDGSIPVEDDPTTQQSTIHQTTAPTSADKTSSNASIPSTGDNTAVVVGALALGGVAVVGLGLALKKRGAGKTFVVLALLVATAASLALPKQQAYAEDAAAKESTTCVLSVDGTSRTVSVAVTYTLTGGDDGSDGNRIHYVFLSNVTLIDDYTGSGTTASYPDGSYSVAVGDQVAFAPTDENPQGSTGIVTNVSTADGVTTVTIDQSADIADTFKSIDIKVSAPVDYSTFEPADGVEIDDEAAVAALSARSARAVELPDLKLKIDKELGEHTSIKGTVKLANTIDADIKWGWPSLVKRCSVELDSNLAFKITGSAKLEKKSSFLLNKKPITVTLPHGFFAFINFKAEVSLAGEVSVTADVSTNAGVSYKKGAGLNPHARLTNSDVSVEAAAKFKAMFAPYINLNFWSAELFDVQVSVGPGADAERVKRPTGMVCNQVDGYLGLDLTAGENTMWARNLHLTAEKNFWDEDTSPLKFKFHFEDGKLVDDCTWQEPVEPDDPDTPDTPDEPDQPEEPDTPEEPAVTPEGDFEYMLDDDGTAIINDYHGESSNVVVPVTIDGAPVAAVSFSALDAAAYPDGISLSFEKGSEVSRIIFRYYGYEGDARISALDLSNAKNLLYIDLEGAGEIQELDFSGLTKLEKAYIKADDAEYDWDADTGTGKLAKITFKDNDALTNLVLEPNSKKLTSLDLSGAPALEWLDVSSAGLREINVNQNNNLLFLLVSATDLKKLDVSNLHGLQDLEVGWNYLTSIALPSHGELKVIDLNNNLLETLDVSPLASNYWQPELNLQYNRLSSDEVDRLESFQKEHFPDATWTLTPQGPEED